MRAYIAQEQMQSMDETYNKYNLYSYFARDGCRSRLGLVLIRCGTRQLEGEQPCVRHGHFDLHRFPGQSRQ